MKPVDINKLKSHKEQFVAGMNAYAKTIGMHSSNFMTIDGTHEKELYNYSTCVDIAKLVYHFFKNKELVEIADVDRVVIHIGGDKERDIPLESTLNRQFIKDKGIMFGKTGTWKEVHNYSFVTEYRGHRFVGVIMDACSPKDRYKAIDELFAIFDCVIDKSDELKSVTYASAAIGYEVMEDDSFNLVYAKNSNDKYPPASITKLLTSLIIYSRIDSLDDTFTLYFDGDAPYHSGRFFFIGDVVTYRSAFSAILLPSSCQMAKDAVYSLME